MKVLIIEDEYRTAVHITRLIKQFDSSVEILGILDSVEKGKEWFTQTNGMPDLLLADIQLTDGNFFDLSDQVTLDLPVIFITAYDEFAIQAFRLNSIDYLLKPLNLEDLKKAMDKYRKTKESYLGLSLNEIRELLTREKPYKQRFLFKHGSSYKYFSAESIALFLAEDGVVFATLLAGGRHIISDTLSELAGMLDPDQFYQISRNAIINIRAIRKISDYFNRRLKVDLDPDHYEVIVSRDRVSDFKKWMDK